MEKEIRKHEDKYLHLPKIFVGNILYLSLALGSWGYLIYRFGKYDVGGSMSIALPFVVLFFVIIAVPIIIYTNRND